MPEATPLNASKTPRPRGIRTGQIPLSLEALDALDADTLAVAIRPDVRPLAGIAGFLDWRLCGEISQLIRSGAFRCEPGEVILISGRGRVPTVRIFLFGYGTRSHNDKNIYRLFGQMVDVLRKASCKKVVVGLPEPCVDLFEHIDGGLRIPLGDALVGIFAPDPLLEENRR